MTIGPDRIALWRSGLKVNRAGGVSRFELGMRSRNLVQGMGFSFPFDLIAP
jgi:hypothetical protein